MELIQEHRHWVDGEFAKNLWFTTVGQGRWNFGQVSNNDTIYPMWVIPCFEPFTQQYKSWLSEPELLIPPITHSFIEEVGNRFMEMIGDEYVLIRNMVSGNTYGQDGDVHDDWLVPGESLTGVLYINPHWQDNWGGETVVYNREDTTHVEISKYETRKFIVFDGSNPHIGKGPQRRCGELRCIVAVQAVKKDAWQKVLDKRNGKS